jgi:hypothetical protein
MPKYFTQEDFEKGKCDKNGLPVQPEAVAAVEAEPEVVEVTAEPETVTGDPEETKIDVTLTQSGDQLPPEEGE